jgi:hypothetical protein
MRISRLTPRPRWLLLVASSACASIQPSQAPPSDVFVADRPVRADRNVITSAEIVPVMHSAYDVVLNRRPQWLHARGMLPSDEGRPELPLVYLEDIRYGDCSALESIEARAIAELRFLDAREATMRFGAGHGAGAILVTLRHR